MLKNWLKAALLMAGSSAALAQPINDMAWDDIVAQAKQEGELTWYVWYLNDDLRRFVKPFEEEYGIKVSIPDGTVGGNADKLLAERSREHGDIDVFSWGFNDFETVDDQTLFYKLDMLPEDNGRVSNMLGIDNGNYALAYWGNQTGIAYDPAQVNEDALPQTPEEFATFWQEHPGKFGFNYENGGSGPSFVTNTMRNISKVKGEGEVADPEELAALQSTFDFFNQYADDYVITTGNADSITRISDGELWMAPAWEDHLAGLQRRGSARTDIKFYIPKMGMNGGSNGVAIPLNAPHPAAAALFVNWLTSPDVQSQLNREFGTAPMNKAADDSHALVPQSQRAYSSKEFGKPFRDAAVAAFIDNVILER